MTTFTREDFEMAAKAAGYTIEGFYPFYGAVCAGLEKFWNPPKDDGDALRLAVALRLSLSFGKSINPSTPGQEVAAWKGPIDDPFVISKVGFMHECDAEAATRRAIFRAAIAIGRAMP